MRAHLNAHVTLISISLHKPGSQKSAHKFSKLVAANSAKEPRLLNPPYIYPTTVGGNPSPSKRTLSLSHQHNHNHQTPIHHIALFPLFYLEIHKSSNLPLSPSLPIPPTNSPQVPLPPIAELASKTRTYRQGPAYPFKRRVSRFEGT